MPTKPPVPAKPITLPKFPEGAVPFGANEVRLNVWHWLLVFGILAIVVLLTPVLWKRLERFRTGPDYRIPYALSKDYWLYGRRLEQIAPTNVIVLGDSVVWGEYVLPEGTLSHFLNEQFGQTGKFINAGVNGLFPLALEGLINYYGTPHPPAAAASEGHRALQCAVDDESKGGPEQREGRTVQPCPFGAAVLSAHSVL